MERLFNYENEEDSKYKIKYKQYIQKFSKNIFRCHVEGKKLLIITGSGISSNVPSMEELMNHLVEIIKKHKKNWEPSKIFGDIIDEYINGMNSSSKAELQSKLITYVQNAYLGFSDYIQPEDEKDLKNIWTEFVYDLIAGFKINDEKSFIGLKKADQTSMHDSIRKLYKSVNTVSITTNFDNLLAKSFEKNNDKFYPILDKEELKDYFCCLENDTSDIEIQSRGDAFWIRCKGNRKKICANRKKRCMIPGMVETRNNNIVCPLCQSDAEVYFAFPGTKEKDEEMSIILDGVWKYLGNSIGAIIIIGSSLDYDPMLIEFVREMIYKHNLPVLYISRLKNNDPDKLMEDKDDIYKNRATSFLLGDFDISRYHTWIRSNNTEDVIVDLINSLEKLNGEYKIDQYSDNDLKDDIKITHAYIEEFYGAAEMKEEDSKLSKYSRSYNILRENEYFKRLSRFSQLGLKTFWLNGKNENVSEHNRKKHSIGVMLNASYLYLKMAENDKGVNKITAKKNEIEFLRMASLLHDVGHLPFSHLLEEVFEELGWIPHDNSRTFNHEYYTSKIIDKICTKDIGNYISELGYTVEELKELISGELGIGYLDALINSPCDCDKIEYLHSDAIYLKKHTEKELVAFLNEFSGDLAVNHSNFLVLSGSSLLSFKRLLRKRYEMYNDIYLRKGLRYLEACCKLIIRIFIVYECADLDRLREIGEDYVFYNFSDQKIKIINDFIEQVIEENGEDGIIEFKILEKMKEAINRNNIISKEIIGAVNKCYKMIIDTNGEDKIKDLEKKYITSYDINYSNVNKGLLKKMLKELYLRFPGVVLVDYIEPKKLLSFGSREERKWRSDGTRSSTENIIIKDTGSSNIEDPTFKCLGDYEPIIEKTLIISKNCTINIYRISNDKFKYMQASDFIHHKLLEEGILL